MGYDDYSATVDQAFAGADTVAHRWNFALAIVARLKADPVSPWVTRGSSRDGTAGTAFSATPDGVDHWTGRTYTQAANSQIVWHVLENVATGLQVCLRINPVGAGLEKWSVTAAMAKFETGGAWRGGGTNAATRPTDTTSTPASGRECATGTALVWSTNASNERWNVLVRKDGRGFYAYSFYDGGAASLAGFLTGVTPLNPLDEITDPNPYVAISMGGTDMGSAWGTLAAGTIAGRLPDGTAVSHLSSMSMSDAAGATSYLDVLNAYYNAYPGRGIILRTVTGVHVRGWVPDAFLISGTTPAANWATRNDRSLMAVTSGGTHRLLMPWDGATVRGTDVAMFMMPGIGTGDPPEVPLPSIVTILPPPAPGSAVDVLADDETDFGIDLDVLTDLPADFRLVGGKRNLAQAIARRFDTDQGWLERAFGGDANYGRNFREKLNGRWTEEDLARAESEAEAECREDERILSAEVVVEHDLATSTLDVNVELETTEGPFSLTLRVHAVTVEVLRIE